MIRRRHILGAGLSAAFVPLAKPLLADNHDGSLCGAEGAACVRVRILWGPNHGHILVIPATDVAAGKPVSYEIRGTSDHTHTVTVGAPELARLAKGEDVRVASTKTGGHLHRLRLRCGPLVDPPAWVSACEVEIGGNDGHELVVTAADLAERRTRSYDIQGVAPHTHEVTLTAKHWDALAAGKLAHVTCTAGDDHTHVLAIHPPKPNGS